MSLFRQGIFLIEGDDEQLAASFLGASGQRGSLEQTAEFALTILGGEPRAALDGEVGGDEVAFPLVRCGGVSGGGSPATQGQQDGVLQLATQVGVGFEPG